MIAIACSRPTNPSLTQAIKQRHDLFALDLSENKLDRCVRPDSRTAFGRIQLHSPAFTRTQSLSKPHSLLLLEYFFPLSWFCPPCKMFLATLWNILPSPTALVCRLVFCSVQAARALALYLSDPRCTLAKLVLSKADVDDFEVGRNKIYRESCSANRFMNRCTYSILSVHGDVGLCQRCGQYRYN